MHFGRKNCGYASIILRKDKAPFTCIILCCSNDPKKFFCKNGFLRSSDILNHEQGIVSIQIFALARPKLLTHFHYSSLISHRSMIDRNKHLITTRICKNLNKYGIFNVFTNKAWYIFYPGSYLQNVVKYVCLQQ